jgi:penicillin amidase
VELAALAADARIVEAAARLAEWDFSHPTGIPEGYDASDADGEREPVVSDAEAQASVAATLYNVWFVELLGRVRASIGSLGLTPLRPMFTFVHLLEQDPYTGVGSSGIDFLPEPAALAAPDRRDLLLLSALDDALDALAGRAYAAAFARSTDQDDYRWGRLKRVVLEHRLGGASTIPPAAGFEDLAPGLHGLARDGTWETVNVSPSAGIGGGDNGFVNSFGSVFRRVASPLRASRSGAGVEAFASLAGGASGDPASPSYASQLGTWLTVDYDAVATTKKQVRKRAATSERFVPAKPKAVRKGAGDAHALD